MGYWSNVRIITTPNGLAEMRKIACELAAQRGLANDMILIPNVDGTTTGCALDFFDKDDYHDYVCFGFNDIKWYEGHYPDVSLVMDTLKIADESDVYWQFVRIGEDNDDNEILYSSTVNNGHVPYINIQRDFTY